MLGKEYFYSIKTKLIFYFLILSLLPLITYGFFVNEYYSKKVETNVIQYTNEVIDRVEQNMDMYINDAKIILKLENDYYIQQYLKLMGTNNAESKRKYTMRICESLNNYKQIKSDLEDIRIINQEGNTISCYGVYKTDFKENDFYQKLFRDNNKDTIVTKPYINRFDKEIFSVLKIMESSTEDNKQIMCIDIKVEILDKICKDIKLGEDGYVYVMDKNGDEVYIPKNSNDFPSLETIKIDTNNLKQNQDNLFSFVDNKNYIISYKKSNTSEWILIGISSKETIYKDFNKLKNINLIVGLFIISFIIFFSIYLTNTVSKPITELSNIMNITTDYGLLPYVEIKTRDEIGQLGSAFNNMIGKIKELMKKSKYDQLKLRKMEMKSLQESIKPHFVYNTLDCIIGLLEQDRTEDAINLIDDLGRFFRISLSHGKEIITTEKELEHIRSYLLIQQYRFSGKFDFIIDIDEDLDKHEILKLILQPLVENAVYHGVKGIDKKGLIIVKGNIEDNKIVFKIIDNGKGIEKEKLANIKSSLQSNFDFEKEEFFGIKNVNNRIKMTYGQMYGLTFESEVGVGTKIKVVIPMDNQGYKN